MQKQCAKCQNPSRSGQSQQDWPRLRPGAQVCSLRGGDFSALSTVRCLPGGVLAGSWDSRGAAATLKKHSDLGVVSDVSHCFKYPPPPRSFRRISKCKVLKVAWYCKNPLPSGIKTHVGKWCRRTLNVKGRCCGTVDEAAAPHAGIPDQSAGFRSQRQCSQSSCLLMCPRGQQRTAQGLGFLSPVWKTQTELLASSFALAVTAILEVREWMDELCLVFVL